MSRAGENPQVLFFDQDGQPQSFYTVIYKLLFYDAYSCSLSKSFSAMESSESPVKTSRGQSVATGSIFDPTTLNQAQFVGMLEKFLGEEPSRYIIAILKIGLH